MPLSLILCAILQAVSPPPSENGRPRVELGVYVVDLWQIDGARQQCSADLLVSARWQDDRLKHPGPGAVALDPDRTWHPRVQVLNARTLKPQGPARFEAAPDGRVLYAERLSGDLSAPLDLARFPFDRQRLRVQLVCPYTAAELEVAVWPARTGRATFFSVPDWHVGPGTAEVVAQEQAASGESLQGVALRVEATRKSGYYVWKVYLPLLFIVLMSWTVFWMDPAKLSGSQVSISVTSMLTLTAYRFSLSNDVPKLSYLTRFDLLFTAVTALVFLALVEVVGSVALETRGRREAARLLDRRSRWAFPAALLAAALLIHLA